ncbi:hypothetical protein PLESTB_000800500 [Pleodorina starrii]|uniref:Uncharacterized protein n=1 Tax=Pleodorina starrii TaxID=330485 RepID=A0A9W6BL44_9CHLO|nr:hypothetical protein PLESTM_000634500 [Pleodorina starrii]GLC53888.1 hypothetical protein PLESTB_000800500 [Pleodorina starrii]GLC75426.1 hypothetical protein PLESTF_001635500 [Pleodorina starrii]
MLLSHQYAGTLVKGRALCQKACPIRHRVSIQRAFIEEKASGGHGGMSPEMQNPMEGARQLVTVNFNDLAAGKDLIADIKKAYGSDGLGVLVISNVPQYSHLRQRLLPLAEVFASLPDAVKDKYVDAVSSYSFGWSHGKESMASGVPDTLKGSFYANPLLDDQLSPGSGDAVRPSFHAALQQQNGAAASSSAGAAAAAEGRQRSQAEPSGARSEAEVSELRRRYPSYFRRNLWPRDEVPELEVAFKELGRLVCAVGCLLMDACDGYVSTQLGTPPGQLAGVLHRSRNPKARLLHYFPPSESAVQSGLKGATGDDQEHEQAWCGLHTDHGSLTGLTAAMYLDEQGREVPSPDPQAGLYIRDRSGSFIRATIPPDCIAFQVGEALQVQSGGLLMATPHYVRAPRAQLARGISRNTFAVFMQPDVMEPINCPPGVEPQRVAVGQWRPGHTFGEFAEATFDKYYSSSSVPQ